MKRTKKLLAVLLASVMTLSSALGMSVQADTCGGLEPEDVYQPSSEEVVKDPILHWAIRAAMNSIKGGVKLTADIVGDKAVKDISYELCAHPEDFETDAWVGKQFWIEDLSGLEYATSSRMIDIAYTSAVEGKSIKDLSPLSGLTQLEQLILKQNGIKDISDLSGLTNLQLLDLSSNKAIEDVSAIKDMTKLTSLNISFNQIKNVDEIANLENLEYVSLSNNQITDLPDLSKLTKVYFFDASANKLTDVTEIAKMKNLEMLNLSGNTGIEDIKPLANLTKLQKDSTTLPDNSKKDDLFAAIEVNKLFELFNISKMQMSDIANVEKALEAYEALTEEQKTYIDNGKVEAARSNKELVESGNEPVYYPEYDDVSVVVPVFDRLEITVVDKKGNPLTNVAFVKKAKGEDEVLRTITTNEQGKLVLEHVPSDTWRGEIVISPESDEYVASPKEITYTVAYGNVTETVNGKEATGLEELIVTLIPKDEYVDKSALAEALGKAEEVERAYKYSEESYQAYESALTKAQSCYDDVDATADDVEKATAALNKAIDELEKLDILTELKLVVKDTNGNIFHRAFKFQIRVPETGAEAWNDYTCPYSGAAYLKTSPGWTDGKTWEILACYEEAYEMTPIIVTIGVTEDGQRYFKTVDGQPVGVDFEKEVVVTYLPENVEGTRKPDRNIVKEAIEYVADIRVSDYTPETAEKLTTAVANAEAVLAKSDVIQEDYNKAISDILAAKEGLVEKADKFQLKKELEKEYSSSYYTAASWAGYQTKLDAATAVYNDGNATQEQVDNALAELKEASSKLVVKADKSKLENKINEAKALEADDYQSGFEALLDAIAEAEKIYAKDDATQKEVDEQIEALEKAIDALVKEVDYACYPGVFKAKVVDTDGNAISGVKFESVIDGKAEEEELVSDENGIIFYNVYSQNDKKTTYIKLADDRYTTEDEHYFEASKIHVSMFNITSIDGKPYEEGIRLTYTLTEAGGETPEPADKVLCDETTFRAKAVDEDGNPVEGVTFNLVPNYYGVSTKTKTTNKDGVLEYTTDPADDYWLSYTVKLAEEDYTSEPESVSFTTGEAAVIMTVAGKNLAEAGEVIFVVKTAEGETPEPSDKVLSDANNFRAKVVDEEGNPVEGVAFALKQGDTVSETLKSDAEGILTYQVGMYEGFKTYTVSLADDKYTSESEDAEFVLENYPTVITTINGKALAEADEVVFVVKAAGGETPDPEPSNKVLSDANNFRAKVVDEEGNAVEGVAFALKQGDTVSETLKSDAEGILTYQVGMYEGYKTYTVALADDKYTSESEDAEFVLEKYPTVITKINGKELAEADEVVFVVKAAGGETPDPEPVDKKELDDQIFFSASYEGKEADYTEESYKVFIDALAEAKEIYADEEATQEQVDEAAQALKAAREGLVGVEKPVTCDKYTIRIPIVDEQGNIVTEPIAFKVGTSTQNVTKGIVEYAISTGDSGTKEIVISPKDEVIVIGEKTYVITPANHKFGLEEFVTGEPEITTIDGEPFDGTKEVKFVLKEQAEEVVVDKDALEAAISEAEAISGDNYTEDSFEALTDAIAAAKAVYDDADATQEEVDAQVLALENAMKALVEKEDPAPSDKVLSDENTFRAKVVDEEGNPVSNVAFNFVPPSYYGVSTKTVTSNENGILEYTTDPEDDFWLSYTVKVAGPEYTSDPESVSFTTGEGAVIMTIDGKNLAEADEVVFVVKAGEVPEPSDKVLSDANTFRAKVVDEEGNAVEGVTFALKQGDTVSETLKSDADGILTYKVGMYEGYKTYTVSLADDKYTSESEAAEFELENYPTVITKVNGKALAEADEVVFVVKEFVEIVVDKDALEAKLEEAKAVSGEKYTEDSFGALTDAIAAAQAVCDDADATQEEVDAQVSALENAIKNLTEKEENPDNPDPEDPKPEEPGNTPGDSEQKPEDTQKPSDSKEDSGVKTGDNANMSVYIWSMIMAAGIAVMMVFMKKRTK